MVFRWVARVTDGSRMAGSMAETDSLPPDQQEELGDLGESGRRYVAVINQADWTVETILQQIDKGNIELNPNFQRREAWRVIHKSQYIESLLLNVPVPQIVLAERRDKRGKFIVIDGKQRLLTLRQFHADATDETYKPFRLTGLSIRTDLNGQDYKSISSDILLETDYDALENSTIRTAVIRNWDDETFLYTVFLRLNTGSVPLSPQELRQALHPGGFVRFVDEYSLDSELLRAALGLSKPDPRMRDAELVIRYFAFRNLLHTYTGNLKPLLDATAKHFNGVWGSNRAEIDRQTADFEAAMRSAIEIFSERNVFRKWNGTRYEAAINRAVYDVMMFYFVDDAVRRVAARDVNSIESAFRSLCMNDEFRTSIEGTTKSIDSIFTRLRMWGDVLHSLSIPVHLPLLVNNKITSTS